MTTPAPRSRVRSVTTWSLIVVGTVAGVLVLRALPLLWHAYAYPRHWQELAARPAEPGAVRIVVFSGSEGVAIGAWRPEEGFAGRIAEHVRDRTGRPVHLTNLSAGGATTGDVLRDQLPRADLAGTDLVILVTGSNDISRGVPPEVYRADLETLLALLPARHTIVSDTPLQSGREPYQQILGEIADKHGMRRADFAGVFRTEGRRLDIFAGDFAHLNSKGYYYWYRAFQPPLDDLLAHDL